LGAFREQERKAVVSLSDGPVVSARPLKQLSGTLIEAIPDAGHVSTSYAERHKLNTRM
jgi:hypothetical protein